MVSKKSIHYGRFDGFQSPLVPKAPRSLRVNSNRKSLEGSAFELLVDVADKLLQESESYTSFFGQEHKEKITLPTVNVKREELEVKVKVKPLKEPSESDNDSGLEHVSDVKTCDVLKKIGNNVKLEPSEGENLDKLGKNNPSHGDIYDYNLVNSIPEIKTVVVEKQSGELTFRDLCVDTCVLNKSYSSVNQPFYKDPISCFTKHRGNVKTGTTDDDDNSYRRNYCGTKMSAFRSQSRVGYRRIRKMLTSRYRKVTPMKDYKLSDPTSDGMKPFYQNRKNIYKRKMRQIEATSKRRKLFHQNSSNTTYVQEASNKVKFSIKSFKVPELYIEMPETATIGSLKGTVMEAVRAILGGELDVGILVEGKKVRENDQTLQQTGISRNCDLKSLGFTLDPSFQKEPTLSLPHDTSQQPSSCTSSPITDVRYSNCSRDHPPATSLDNYVDKNREIVPLLTEVLTEERVTDSKPLVPIIPVDQNLIKKSDVSQRRIRRPFSVSEVEALVEAVEKLGTGRWRDIKLRAFDDASHRTYVDLKDKWKTLVHTASIAPQQRRGEAVPQNLLDRVLTAHRYWSNNQLKQQRKPCTETAFEN